MENYGKIIAFRQKGQVTLKSKPFEDGSGFIPNLQQVTHESKKFLKKYVLQFATYFRREFHYDFIQFDIDDKDNYRAYLFSDWEYVFGATCFRWRKWKNTDPSWAMQWIWIHPFWRHKGILTEAWKDLKKFHSPFLVETPISNSMENFLKKTENETNFVL